MENNKKSLNIKDLVGVKSEKPKFNTLEALATIVDGSKMPIFTHEATNVDIIAAKDTGKSFVIDLYKIYGMERDPMASCLTLMKYSTNAAKRGTRSFAMALNNVKRTFDLPRQYEDSQSFVYRYKDKRKDKMEAQSVEYGSFENSDGLAGYTVPNGGYPFLIHIEEPAMQNDTNTVSLKQWNADVKTIVDTVKRHWRDYNATKPYFAPIKLKIITSMNDWDPEHPVSKRAERYFPQKDFLDWCLGFKYSELLELWKDKVDLGVVVPELKLWVDEHWEEIKANVFVNHTGYRYVKTNAMGELEDRLIVRMQKFGNPAVRADEDAVNEVYSIMYSALIQGDSYGLAYAFGMGFSGTSDDQKRFTFKSLKPVDTWAKLHEPGRQMLGFSIGWDHDANRGPVGTPATLSAKVRNVGTPFDPEYEYYDYKVLLHPQIIIEGYGKGQMGQNTALYHEMMLQESISAKNHYCQGKEFFPYGINAVFDDDDGSYVSKLAKPLLMSGFTYADALENKNGQIETGGFGVVSRDKIWESAVDYEDIMVDRYNKMLMDWLKQVPRVETSSGETKRSVKGKWGERYKDISNSAEYAWWVWRYLLLSVNGLE